MNISLEGKKAIVCGSTQGIGKSCALEIAMLGADVTVLARNESELQNVKVELDQISSGDHKILVADFSNPEYLKSQLQSYLEGGSHVDILINNTGGPPGGPIIDADFQAFRNALDLHLHCNHLLVQAVTPHMKSAGFGRIINIISTSVKIPIPGLGVSNTVRGAVASWAKTLSIELGVYGITVNNVLPGFTDTVRLHGIIKNKAAKTGLSEERVIEDFKKETPAGRFGLPEEIASLAAFLATPAAAYINGTSIPVDGGRTGSI
ncbi:MAG: SDR family oxidoreductase [Bacteroidota bacterium]